MEQFAIPGVGGIIIKSIDSVEGILLQERCKREAPDVKGNLLKFSNEAKNYKWIPTYQIEAMLKENPKKFYPMHIDTLKKYISTIG